MVATLTKLCNKTWNTETVPADWKECDSAIAKKGDLSDCSNWRAIALLSIPGKNHGKHYVEQNERSNG